MRIFILSLVLCICLLRTNAQTSSAATEYHVGDIAPDFKLSLINGSGQQKLSDFKGKCIILDFWATWCGACLGKFPMLDSLQRKYGERLQIIAVTLEDSSLVSTFIKTNPLNRSVSFLYQTNDIAMRKAFPYRMVPQLVWLDSDRRVKGITFGEDLTEENVKHLISGQKLDALVKADAKDFNKKNLFLKNNHPFVIDNLLFQSAFYKAFPGVGSGGGGIENKKLTRIASLNESVLGLYRECLGEIGYNPISASKQIVLEVADYTKYIDTGKFAKKWMEQHSYCYEIVVPKGTPFTRTRSFMVQDLNRYLNLNRRR